jgi:hypothetical protein
MPPRLRAPGLREDTAGFITGVLSPPLKRNRGKVTPGGDPAALKTAELILGPPGSGGFASRFGIPDDAVLAKLAAEREQFRKKNELSVKSRRFVRRNVTVLTIGFAALALLALSARSVAKSRADLPTTRGMTPVEVIEAYYGAFGTLDHTLMEACVIDRAGKNDISMITNIFVISRVRQAYEMNIAVTDAREWLQAGSPPTEASVVGVTDLRLLALDEDAGDGELGYRASGFLWLPEGREDPPPDTASSTPEAAAPPVPGGYAFTDELRLVRHKDAWRIAGLTRSLGERD